MRKIKRITLEERKIIEQKLLEGVSYNQIAIQLKRNPSCLYYEISKTTVDGVYNAEYAHNIKRNPGKKKYYLSLHERKVIQEFIAHGHSFADVAKQINRCDSTVGREVRSNGGREFYNAEKAHENFINARNETEENKNDGVDEEVIKRIEAIETQLDMIFELIKELKDDKKD